MRSYTSHSPGDAKRGQAGDILKIEGQWKLIIYRCRDEIEDGEFRGDFYFCDYRKVYTLTVLFFSCSHSFMTPKSGNISQFPPFMRCVNHSYISAVCPSCWQLNVLNEKLITLSTAVVFAMGSKLYRKPPPEGNILNQVVKCIWVSSWILCLPFSITRKEMLFWAYRPSNMGIYFSQWPLHCFCDFWKVGLIKLHLMPLFNL